MTRHTAHWHGTRAVAGPVDEGGCCAGEAGWQEPLGEWHGIPVYIDPALPPHAAALLSGSEPALGATNAPTAYTETTDTRRTPA